MKTTIYSIKQTNHILELLDDEGTKLLDAKWFMEFGKFIAEIFNTEKKTIYSVSKKFKFWKWKMTYTIKNAAKETFFLEAQNRQNTIFKVKIQNAVYEVKIHYGQQKSIFKNGNKIAEIDQSFSKSNFKELIKITLLESENIELVFLLFTALQIGESNQKSILKSQKTLIPNEESWDS